MPTIPSLEALMKAGVHFGHAKSKWHPKMAPFIYTHKNKIHIINLEQTQKQLETALSFVKETAARGGVILFLGTKKQAQAVIKEAATKCGMPYITERWLGGTFTNSRSVLALAKKYKRMKVERDKGLLERYTKRERLKYERKIEKLEPLVGGIEDLNKIPDAMFVIDIKNEKTAVLEGVKENVPMVAICDTNVNPLRISYPIPANDDAVKSIKLITDLVADAVLEGKAAGQAVKAEAPKKPADNKPTAPVTVEAVK
ncbi:TPA: 30S ribosomal protein S2 [Candidatus Falkowbacteria bacterium]|nr:30S ribosomal protein S2 [Candidatus Falkowbacteria bacterium]